MGKEFNLSEKIERMAYLEETHINDIPLTENLKGDGIRVSNIMEFIKRLREDFKKKLCKTGFTYNSNQNKGIRLVAFEQFEEVINKLTGDKLI